MKKKRSSRRGLRVGALAVSMFAGLGIWPAADAWALANQCRASLVRVGTTGYVEANTAENPCVAAVAPTSVANPQTIVPPSPPGPDMVVEVSMPYARTATSGRQSGRGGNDAEAGASEVTIALRGTVAVVPDPRNPPGELISVDGPGYIYVDGITSSARCEGAKPTAKSYVGAVRSSAYGMPVLVEVPPAAVTGMTSNHFHVALPGATLHLNEQTIVGSRILQRALYVDFVDPSIPDIAVAESMAQC